MNVILCLLNLLNFRPVWPNDYSFTGDIQEILIIQKPSQIQVFTIEILKVNYMTSFKEAVGVKLCESASKLT